MGLRRLSHPLVLSFILVLLLPAVMFAGDRREAASRPSVSAATIEWLPAGDYDSLQLSVKAPDGTLYVEDFPKGKMASFPRAKATVDGTYNYEVRATPKISDEVKARLAAARAAGDDDAIRRIQREAGIREPIVQSGVFTVRNGSFVAPDVPEPRLKAVAPNAGGISGPLKPTPADQVIADDLIVQGSACVGLDCVNNESFGFDTLRLKENNTRIKFDDTSTSAGFPNVDWQLTANDSGSGGANKFSIEDITDARVPFTVLSNAPTNALFVDANGIGIGTNTNVLDINISTTDTPAIRMAQTNGGGFTAQTWDIGANEANWFVRDLTGGSRLPLRIRPGAPTSSIDISATGLVGIGTASPSQHVHVFDNTDANTIMEIENQSAGTSANATLRAQADSTGGLFDIKMHSSGRVISRFGKTLGGWAELLSQSQNGAILGTLGAQNLVLGTNSVNRLEINGSTGAITVSGNFTVTGVKNFAMPDPADSSKAIYYASLEGPEAGTYYRGTAKTVNGEVSIDLPGYFARITEADHMTVQLTPVGAFGQVYVVSRTPEKIVIKTAKGSDDVEFDYFVQGIRKGYSDFKVVRDNDLPNQH